MANDRLRSILDWSQHSNIFSSVIHASVLNNSGVECDVSRVSLGSIVKSGGIFDLDDLQIFSEAFSSEKLKDNMLGNGSDVLGLVEHGSVKF